MRRRYLRFRGSPIAARSVIYGYVCWRKRETKNWNWRIICRISRVDGYAKGNIFIIRSRLLMGDPSMYARGFSCRKNGIFIRKKICSSGQKLMLCRQRTLNRILQQKTRGAIWW